MHHSVIASLLSTFGKTRIGHPLRKQGLAPFLQACNLGGKAWTQGIIEETGFSSRSMRLPHGIVYDFAGRPVVLAFASLSSWFPRPILAIELTTPPLFSG